MARITVEDCLDHVANRFELVMVATKRARDLAIGAKDPMVPWENDKATVVALREIALGYIDRTYLDGNDMNDDEQGGEEGGGDGGNSPLGNIDFSMPL